MTLAEWQSSGKLVVAWREMIETELFRAAMSVLREIGPTAFAPSHNADHATKNAALLLGQIQDFEQVMRNIKLLASATPDQPKQPTASYGAKAEPK